MKTVTEAQVGEAVVIHLDGEMRVEAMAGKQVMARQPGTRRVAVLDQLNCRQRIAYLPLKGRSRGSLGVKDDQLVLSVAHQFAEAVTRMALLTQRGVLK